MEEEQEKLTLVMKSYAESAKSFTQLSTAVLTLPIIFRKQLLGTSTADEGLHDIDLMIITASWLLFLVAVGAGTFYQYISVKFLEIKILQYRTYIFPLFKRFVEAPGIVYGLMIASFFGGVCCFVVYSILLVYKSP